MAVLAQDLKLAVRTLWRRPAFTLTAVLTLAIGMGVNAVAFTVVNGLLFRGPAMNAPDDLGRIIPTPGGDESGYASIPEFERFKEATSGVLDLAAEGRSSLAWQQDGATETAWVLFVSSNYFSIVTAQPIAGRVDISRGTGERPSVLIGERFWRSRLREASLAGLTLRLNNVDVNVAGVLPRPFHGPSGIYSPDVWISLDELTRFNTSPALQKRDQRWLFLLGRVAPATNVPAVQGRLDTAAATMARDWADSHRDRGARFRRFQEGNGELRGLTTGAAIAMSIIGLVLLLACFNVANLLLARAVERERDMAVRAAIGAGPTRLVRLVVTEGMVLAVLAGAAAFVIASWTQVLVGSFAIPIEQPQFIDVTPDRRVLVFIGFLVVIAGVLPGVWPAVTAARIDIVRVLASQGANLASGKPNPMRRWLVAAQVAGSTAFLAIAALLAQTYGRLALADLGFDRDQLVVAEFEPASHGYRAEESQRYVEAFGDRVRALPGVTSVAIADRVPFFIGFERVTPISTIRSCERDDCPKIATMKVGSGYFTTTGIPLASGREFDGNSAGREVIINQPLARQLWPDRGALGEALWIGDRGQRATVVAITATTQTRSLNREQPTLYVPLDRNGYEGPVSLIAHSNVAPETLVRPIIDAAHEVDDKVALLSVKTMEQRLAVPLWPFRTVRWLFSICGTLALILATVGVAGVVIHAVNRRLREFGVRMSVGATPRDLLLDVLGGSAKLLVPGVIAGTVLAALVARLLQAAFYGVSVLNPLTYVAVALVEVAVVLLACISPAIRAARIDPLIALRSE